MRQKCNKQHLKCTFLNSCEHILYYVAKIRHKMHVAFLQYFFEALPEESGLCWAAKGLKHPYHYHILCLFLFPGLRQKENKPIF